MEYNDCDGNDRPELPDAASHALRDIVAARIDVAWRLPGGRWEAGIPDRPRGILSGAFNPRHQGHVALRLASEHWLGAPVAYELTLINADKPRIDMQTALSRAAQFDDAPLALTLAPTFAVKARLLPQSIFIAGADTAVRIVDPQFYASGPVGLRNALAEIRDAGCSFLVAARWHSGRLLTLTDVPVPADFADLFEALPEREFRCDVSSTQLRRSAP